MAGGRRCARPGCRAWAMRGATVCRAHRDRADGQFDVDMEAGEREPTERYARLLAERAAALVETNPEDITLTDQLAALRLLLARVLADEVDTRELARDIPRIVDATVRAIRAQRTVDGAAAQGLTRALTEVLLELRLGEEG